MSGTANLKASNSDAETPPQARFMDALLEVTDYFDGMSRLHSAISSAAQNFDVILNNVEGDTTHKKAAAKLLHAMSNQDVPEQIRRPYAERYTEDIKGLLGTDQISEVSPELLPSQAEGGDG